MRIHLSIPPSSVATLAKTSPTDPPLVQIGKDLIMIELQGSLGFEGDPSGKVIGVLGFDRMDKPTLHLGQHHLLHGKIVNLPKPLAILRRKAIIQAPISVSITPDGSKRRVVDSKVGDADAATTNETDDDQAEDDLDEEDLDLGETQDIARRHDLPNSSPPGPSSPALPNSNKLSIPQPTPTRPNPSSSALPAHLRTHITPLRPLQLGQSSGSGSGTGAASSTDPMSSSPIPMPYQSRDYSSDLSSPIRGGEESESEEDSEDENGGGGQGGLKGKMMTGEKRKRRGDGRLSRREDREPRVERTKEYEVVGVIRKKVVFALRPEPIVTATILPD